MVIKEEWRYTRRERVRQIQVEALRRLKKLCVMKACRASRFLVSSFYYWLMSKKPMITVIGFFCLIQVFINPVACGAFPKNNFFLRIQTINTC